MVCFFYLGIISGISHVFTTFFLSFEVDKPVSEIYSQQMAEETEKGMIRGAAQISLP